MQPRAALVRTLAQLDRLLDDESKWQFKYKRPPDVERVVHRI
jgi:hypothetical protein